MNKKRKYVVATLLTIVVGVSAWTDNKIPEWPWMIVTLIGYVWLLFFGIAEEAYKVENCTSFKKIPMTCIGVGGIIFASILAFIQMIQLYII